VLLAPLQRRLVHAVVHHDHRHRLQDPHNRARRQARQAADMGHGGPGALPHHHHSVLPRRHGHPASLRCHGRALVQQYVITFEVCWDSNIPPNKRQISAPGSPTSSSTPPKASTRSSSATNATGKRSAPSRLSAARRLPTNSASPF
jgi:hypothetical protein